MMRVMRSRSADFPRRAFSLIEVTITLGVMAFALVGLLGLLPLALEQSRLSIDETRSAHLARMVGTTLESEPYTDARCFAESGPHLDFSTITAGSPPVILFASYWVGEDAGIVRTVTPPPNAEYRIELRFDPAPLNSGAENRGQAVQIRILNWPAQKKVFEGVHFISRLSRNVRVP